MVVAVVALLARLSSSPTDHHRLTSPIADPKPHSPKMVLPETPSHTPLAHDEEVDLLESLSPQLADKFGGLPPSRVPVTVRPGESLMDKIPDSVRQEMSQTEEEEEYQMGDVFKSVVLVSPRPRKAE